MKRVQPAIQFTKQPYIEDVGPRKIESIRFSTLGESEILKAAEVQVNEGVYYDPSKKPIEHGLLDPRMGPPNKNGTCETCSGNFRECPGHYGYLMLNLPVYHAGYLANVLNILKCICKQCSSLLLGEKDKLAFLQKMRNPRLEPLGKSQLLKRVVEKCNRLVASGKKATVCAKCGYINGMVKKNTKTLGIIHERSKINDTSLNEYRSAVSHTKEYNASSLSVPDEINPKLVYSLLKNMKDEDCELLYLNDRPEKLMVTCVAVPPIAIRPSVFVDGGTQRVEH